MTTTVQPITTTVPNYSNGAWQNSGASEWEDVTNPATGEVLARVP